MSPDIELKRKGLSKMGSPFLCYFIRSFKALFQLLDYQVLTYFFGYTLFIV